MDTTNMQADTASSAMVTAISEPRERGQGTAFAARSDDVDGHGVVRPSSALGADGKPPAYWSPKRGCDVPPRLRTH
jgi:hypothetical protein